VSRGRLVTVVAAAFVGAIAWTWLRPEAPRDVPHGIDRTPTSSPASFATASRVESAPESRSAVRMAPAGAPARPESRGAFVRAATTIEVLVLRKGGAPIAGAAVEIAPIGDPDLRFQARPMTGTTDARGSATFGGWPNGVPFRATASRTANSCEAQRDVYPPPGATSFTARLVEGGLGRVTGRLVASEDRSPLAGAVRVQGGIDTATDPKGRFSLLVPQGKRRFEADGADRSILAIDLETIGCGDGDLGDVALDRSWELVGRIVEADGSPKPDVGVHAGGGPMQSETRIVDERLVGKGMDVTDDEGRFRLWTDRADGPVWLHARSASARVNVVPRRFGPFAPSADDVTLVWEALPRLVVELRDPLSGRPRKDAQVTVWRFEESKLVFASPFGAPGSDGAFTIEDVPPGDCVVRAFSTAWHREPDAFGATARAIRVERSPETRVVIDVEPASCVHLRFVDTERRALARIPVRAVVPDGAGMRDETILGETDFEGRVRFDVPPRTVRVSVEVEGIESWTVDVEPRTDCSETEIVLRRTE